MEQETRTPMTPENRIEVVTIDGFKLQIEIELLRDAIRKHRDQRGDDRCWMDDEELYRVLPEGYTPPARDSAVQLENCKRFIACRENPATYYVSPEREIERLKKQVDGLQRSLVDESGKHLVLSDQVTERTLAARSMFDYVPTNSRQEKLETWPWLKED